MLILVCITSALMIAEGIMLIVGRGGALARYGILQGVLSLLFAVSAVTVVFVVWVKVPLPHGYYNSTMNTMITYQVAEYNEEIACNDNDRYYPGTTEDCIFQGTYGMGRPNVA